MQRGGVLLSMLVIVGMMSVMLMSASFLVNRQFHAVTDQQVEDLAFNIAESGVQYTIFLLNDGIYGLPELLSLGAIVRDVNDEIENEKVGEFQITYSEIEEPASGDLKVVARGVDSALGRCRQVTATIGRQGDEISSGYMVTSWNQDLGCSPFVSPSATPTPTPEPACNNGLDDDNDTFIDYPSDPECLSSADTSEQSAAP